MIQVASLAFSLKNSNQIIALVIKDQVTTKPWSGFSACYALAEYMVKNFPKINLTLDPSQTPQIVPDQKEESEYLSYHPLLQFWADLIQQNIIDGNAARVQNKLYVLIELQQEPFTQFQEYNQLIHRINPGKIVKSGKFQKIQGIFGITKIQQRNKKVGFIVVGPIQLNTDIYKPVMNASALLIGSIYNNQNWSKFCILVEQMPSVQVLRQFDLLIIPGSNYSVLSLHEKVDQFIKNSLQAFKQSQKLKIVGICYSHQLISLKAGALVQKRQRKKALQTIQFNKEVLSKYSFLQPLKNYEQKIIMDEFHDDYVMQIPQQYELLAHSKSSKIQGLVHKSGRIITFQFHPDYQLQFDLGFQYRYRKYHKLVNEPWIYTRPNQQILDIHEKSVRIIRQCITNFIDS